MKDWRTAAPSGSRVQLPIGGCFGWIACLLMNDRVRSPRILMLIFDAYGRPFKILDVLWEDDILKVCVSRISSMPGVTLQMKPQERGQRKKGSKMDESVMIDENDFPGLKSKLLQWPQRNKKGDRLFT
eukprot:3134495-Heterocapsa_arctica.AAC.1